MNNSIYFTLLFYKTHIKLLYHINKYVYDSSNSTYLLSNSINNAKTMKNVK